MFASQIELCETTKHKPDTRSFLKGPDECGLLVNKDGTVRHKFRSKFCFMWFYLILGISVIRFISVAYLLSKPRREVLDTLKMRNSEFLTSVVITLVASFANPYIMYNHCLRCNGWEGAMKIVVLSIVLVSFEVFVAYDTVKTAEMRYEDSLFDEHGTSEIDNDDDSDSDDDM